jgi:hypothetical protein
MKEDYGRMSDVDGGQYWTKQSGSASLEGAQACATNILEALGKWYYEKSGGNKLLLTSGTDGSHSGGTYSHANGWKIDVSDYSGAGLLVNSTSEPGPLVDEFLRYGASLGLGMNWEGYLDGAANNEHIDVAFNGNAWSHYSYGGNGWEGGASGVNNGTGNASTAKGGTSMSGSASSDQGFRIVPKGRDRVEITKLPQGKTYCEPIYPDLICVSDTIPQWVLANTLEVTNKDTEQTKDNEGADSDVKAPNGKFFKQNDLQYLLDNKYTKEQAIAILSETNKYKKVEDTKKEESKDNKQTTPDKAKIKIKKDTSTQP